ncbi:hypothetical protein CLG96_11555 [Sphingomonas oleivorans]|uniref:Type I secretion protein TolC n=1 Tax=Sphingomonas oleivorans TaxID=1735121 RepID=A0A2T5FVK8_9SPHN|nr:TolC family outer membrane protein [Sphingomonas oleivorans]PTQ09808.1 hypothetical protein CLG96_11555 [Sphingomonas oleivorans]
MRLMLRAGVCLAAMAAMPAQADTLREALEKAYRTNPTLTGARAGQRATDEGVPIAKAGARPSLSASGGYNEFVVPQGNSVTAPTRSIGGRADLGMPIFQGGAVKNGIRAADARVLAGRAGLRSIEADVFTRVVAAYMDVIRDQSIVSLNENNVRVLETNLAASRDRFQVGDLTRTDVSQSEARLAIAMSSLETARAQLDGSRENYLEVVGSFPQALETPPSLPSLPTMADDAVDVAIENNPALESARQRSRAADYDVRVANAARLPTLSATAGGSYANFLGTVSSPIPGASVSQMQKSVTLGVGATLPLYQGGQPAARVRQAQALASQSLEEVTETERAVVADARTAYSQYRAAQSVIASSQTAVSANELALEGVRAENSVGTRDILDVLNAEQELLNSRVQLVTARRDAYVAGFALLAAMGRAEARDLGLDGGALYDPELNYKRVRNRISDWDSDPKPVPVATRTVDVPAPEPTSAAPVPSTPAESTPSPAQGNNPPRS